MTSTRALVLLDFFKEFIINCDASSVGIGVILMQEGHPISFASHALSLTSLGMLTYEKELMAMVFVVRKWHSYLAYTTRKKRYGDIYNESL